MRYNIVDANLVKRIVLFSQIHRTNPPGGSNTFMVVSENLVPVPLAFFSPFRSIGAYY